MTSKTNRRQFIRTATLTGAGLAFLSQMPFYSAFANFDPVDVENPLKYYPNRDWESVYRDIWNYDSEFTFLCAPNDTHNCLLKAHVKNDTITRIAPSYAFGEATDLQGNQASSRWEPRCCQKGLALTRRFYGDRRIKYPVIREGFLQWIKDGMPRDDGGLFSSGSGKPPEKYFKDRGKEGFVKISWEEAYEYMAMAQKNIAEAYSGSTGQSRLQEQGYDPLMVDKTKGAGTQVLKYRGGMAALGITRIFGVNRLANAMALLDDKIRDSGPEEALGARTWDSYAWHTDLPPGHPMVTGQQTIEWDLVCVEYTDHVIVWGMNWITTKMPDSHWLTETRMKGAKITVIACEYSATCNKADNVLVVRPGVTPSLALGFIHVILKEGKYDTDYLNKYTDMPFLVRQDNGKFLKPEEIIEGYENQELDNYLQLLKEGENPPEPTQQGQPYVNEQLRDEWGDFVVWDKDSGEPLPVSRDVYGKVMEEKGINAALEGSFNVTLTNGEKVEVKPVFDLVSNYVLENYDLDTVSEMTWAPKEGIEQIAREIADKPGKSLFAMGMGPNQFFNNDLKDRTVLMLAALTQNIGRVGGNVGSYAGNYRAAFFAGLPFYIAEDPFNIQLDESKPATPRGYFKYESAHYFNNTDRILRVGERVLTGDSHMPTPTKSIFVNNGNSLLANNKGHYEAVVNSYPNVEFIGVADWWWTGSCEYADIVFPVDSWSEFKYPDATMSVTNPFLYVFPRTPLQRIYDTKGDIEVLAGVAKAMGKLTGDKRFEDYFKFIHENKPEVYLQRIFDNSPMTKGYNFLEVEEEAKKGIPKMMMTRTYPKYVGYEQAEENKTWYTKTGRLEFYRDEEEFLEAGENLPVHREPVDSSYYEPNVIVGKNDPIFKHKTPEDYGLTDEDRSGDQRQGRNVLKAWKDVKQTKHPLTEKDPDYKFIFHTPKYRHGAHTTPVDTDLMAVWFGPFGDMHRHDKRTPFVSELYVDINPQDAIDLGIEDGDYVWIDGDPEDRPFRGMKDKMDTEAYELSRLLCRARYYPGTPRGVTRMWHNAFGSTYGSIQGAKKRKDKLAKNPKTNYQSMFRRGSHQSATRAWLKATHQTDTLVRKNNIGQGIDKGWELDVHGVTGAPREAMVRIKFAEKGGIDGKKPWIAVEKQIRPMHESDSFKKYMQGGFVKF